jgi:hypothetical protein
VLTATAGVISAITGLLVVLFQLGVFSESRNKPRPDSSAENLAQKPGVPPAPPVGNEAIPDAGSSTQAASALPSEPVNLLLRDNGGQLLTAPTDAWAATIDGVLDDYREVKVQEEAVYAFRNETAETFNTFGMLIPKSGRVPKRFELSVSNEALTGPFRSIGTFEPKNIRLMQSEGWQVFQFPSVTAKYLKVKLLASYEADVVWIDLYEFRLFEQNH